MANRHGDFIWCEPLTSDSAAAERFYGAVPGRGDPATHCGHSHPLLRLHAEGLADSYLDSCCRAGRLRREAVLAWLPCVTAARLAEDAPAESGRLSAFVGAL